MSRAFVICGICLFSVLYGSGSGLAGPLPVRRNQPLIIDHTCTDIGRIPRQWLMKTHKELGVWYGHTSHGSQITSGMNAINSGNFRYGSTPNSGALLYIETGGDLGHNGNLRWSARTKAQLNRITNKANVVMWSWCGGVSGNTVSGINAYLLEMTKLELEYPDVFFVYMTGHLDGSGVEGNLNVRNDQIRDYCKTHNKILFDFADIESFDPDGNNFLELGSNDACDYSSNGDNRRDSNWCDDWIARNPDHRITLPSSAAHTRPLNGALKGRAFWWMMARLAGWDGR